MRFKSRNETVSRVDVDLWPSCDTSSTEGHPHGAATHPLRRFASNSGRAAKLDAPAGRKWVVPSMSRRRHNSNLNSTSKKEDRKMEEKKKRIHGNVKGNEKQPNDPISWVSSISNSNWPPVHFQSISRAFPEQFQGSFRVNRSRFVNHQLFSIRRCDVIRPSTRAEVNYR